MRQSVPGRQLRAVVVLVLGVMAMLGCSRDESYPSRPITIVCPWAAGGGTDRVSRQLAMQLEQEMGVPVSVVNATGGKGVTGHNRGLTARADGYTLTMMTFELNTMHWIGLTDLTYRDSLPLVSVNEDYAALLVATDAPWRDIGELEAEIRLRPGELTASGTAVGGAWHLALAGWLLAAGIDAEAVVWVPSEGANPSLQELMSGGVQMVCCSLPEARTLIESDQVRALGVMSPARAKGFEEVKTFQEQGRDWTLGGWRGLGVPRDTPEEVAQPLLAALRRIVSSEAEGSFAAFMETQKFDHTWRDAAEFEGFLLENDDKLGALLKSDAMRSVTQNRFSPMAFPYALMGLLVISVLGIFFTSIREEGQEGKPSSDRTMRGMVGFGWTLAAIAAYAMLAETLGFMVISSILLIALMLWFGTRPVPAVAITLVFVPSLYFLFAYGLRVPLPRGWLG